MFIMPIEIRELHIRAVIDTGGKHASPGPGGAASGAPAAASAESPEQLVQLCVEKVLEILKEKKER